MTQYSHLEIYKKSDEFLLYYSHLFPYFQREYRYTLGERILNMIIDFIILIYRANDARTVESRAEFLKEMEIVIQRVSVCLRLACQLHNFSQEKYFNCCKFLQDIEKQLSGWLKYTLGLKGKQESENISQITLAI